MGFALLGDMVEWGPMPELHFRGILAAWHDDESVYVRWDGHADELDLVPSDELVVIV